MAIEDYMDEARGLAAHSWCDDETSHLVMIPELAEAVARRLAAWMDNAAEFCRNMQYYRGLLDQCAENLGPLRPKVFVQDDGGIVDEPLRAKLPELVAELATHARKWMLVEQAVNESKPVAVSPSQFSDLPVE